MKTITMKAYKEDGWLHYEKPLQLIEKRYNMYSLYGSPNRKLTHHTRNKVFTSEKHSIEIFFSDRWYTIACIVNLDATIDYFYCNIAKPCVFTDEDVSFIDMDLDVIIQNDMTYKVIDYDDFKKHKIKYGYSEALIEKTEEGVQTIIEHLEKKVFPFDGYFYTLIKKIIG